MEQMALNKNDTSDAPRISLVLKEKQNVSLSSLNQFIMVIPYITIHSPKKASEFLRRAELLSTRYQHMAQWNQWIKHLRILSTLWNVKFSSFINT